MKILSLDIGTQSIKALEVDTVFGKYEIQDHIELPIDAETGRTAQVVLQEFMSARPRRADRIIVAMPTSRVTFRNLVIPSRDRKTIQSAVRFELEDDLPFDLDQAFFEYSPTRSAKGSTSVHIAATLQSQLETYLGWLQAAGCDPDVITTEAWSFSSLLGRVLPNSAESGPVLIVQMGHSRTLIHAQDGPIPLFIREIAWGGKDLAEVIGQALSQPLSVAEKILREKAALLPENEIEQASQEARVLSMAVQSVLEPLILEIRQAMLMTKSACGRAPVQIFTSGGPSQLPGLWREIDAALPIPSTPLRALSSSVLSGVTYSESSDALFASAMGQALALVGPKKAQLINLRRGSLAKKSAAGPSIPIEHLKKPALGLLAAALVLVITLIVEGFVYQSRLEQVNLDLERSIKGFFGTITPTNLRQYMGNTANLKKAIDREMTKQKDLARVLAPASTSALDPLRDLSKEIGKDLNVDLMQYQVGAAPDKTTPETGDLPVELVFWVSSAQMAEKIATVASTYLENPTRGKIEEVTTSSGEKRWKLPLTGKAKLTGGRQ